MPFDPAKTWIDYLPEWYVSHATIKKNITTLLRDCAFRLGLKSAIEIGGGVGVQSVFFDPYTNIDPATMAIVHGRQAYPRATFIEKDFFTVKPEDCHKADLLFAIDVIEHTPSFEQFMDHMLEFDPIVMLVTFFNRLSHKSSEHVIRASSDEVHFSNIYSAERVVAYLKRNSLLYLLWRIPQSAGFSKCNDVLIATKHSDVFTRFPDASAWKGKLSKQKRHLEILG